MNIEADIFKKSKIVYSSLEKYGFKKDKDIYVYERPFFNNDFKAIITIDKSGNIRGKVIDIEINEEYLVLRTEMSGEFSNRVREEFKKVLIDIRNNCCMEELFVFDQSNRITKYIKDKYNSKPEFLWEDDYEDGVFRNNNSGKWFGIIMYINYSKIDKKPGKVEVMNVKLDKDKIKDLIKKPGYYEAYHMNKKYWISIVLNDTLSDNEIISLIDESYNLVK